MQSKFNIVPQIIRYSKDNQITELMFSFSSSQISITVFSIIGNLVQANYANYNGGNPDPWYLDIPYSAEATDLISHYTGQPFPYDSLKHGTDPVPSFVPKKFPREDKTFKKVSPFYALSQSNDPKFQQMVMKSNAPYCHEITAKDTKTGASRSGLDDNKMTCYRCKDPKSGSTYEHCSYNSNKPRGTRSNSASERSLDALTSSTNHRETSKESVLPDNFRFSEDYFDQPSSSRDHQHHHHHHQQPIQQQTEQCEKVIKDSMVCMVCKDPKTNGKYEQCSYVANPKEKAYAYSKSSSFGNPKHRESTPKDSPKKTKPRATPAQYNYHPRHYHEEEDEEHDKEAEADHRHYSHEEPEEQEASDEDASAYSDEKEGHSSHDTPEHTYHYPSHYGSYENDEESEEAAPSHNAQSDSGDCKIVQKNGESCKICTDPKTGGKSENCEYSHEPKDKFYKYTKSKTFGYPESEEKAENNRDSGSAEDYSYAGEPSTVDYIKSESEKISKQVKDQGDCKKVKKDSMICMVCKDPKTGGNFEQCNYSYEPEDRAYAYTKSKQFGNPAKTDGNEEYEEHPEETYGLPVIYPTGTSPLDYIPKTSESQMSSVYANQDPHHQVVHYRR